MALVGFLDHFKKILEIAPGLWFSAQSAVCDMCIRRMSQVLTLRQKLVFWWRSIEGQPHCAPSFEPCATDPWGSSQLSKKKKKIVEILINSSRWVLVSCFSMLENLIISTSGNTYFSAKVIIEVSRML